MGQNEATIEELLEMVEDNSHDLSPRAMLRLSLVLIKESYKHQREMNGALQETVTRVSELERYPSLIALFYRHPKQSASLLVFLIVVANIFHDLNLVNLIGSYIRSFW